MTSLANCFFVKIKLDNIVKQKGHRENQTHKTGLFRDALKKGNECSQEGFNQR